MSSVHDERSSILDLYTRYAETTDSGEFENWAACFTETGTLRSSRRESDISGREALIEFARERREESRAPERHISWNHSIDIDGSTATGRCSAALLRTAAEGVTVVFTATYRDRFEKQADGWLISSRYVSIDEAVSEGSSPDTPNN